MSEFTPDDTAALAEWVDANAGRFELFLHAFDNTAFEQRLLAAAGRVYCGNRELSHQLAPARPDIVELFCPGTLLNSQRFQDTELKVFTFGMAHKIRVPLYRRLRDLLDATGKSYSVYVSTALHENTSFDASFVVRFEELQAIFNGQVYFMGYLSDTAVFNHLIDCYYIAAFFEKGLRANNTTVNAAMECGCAVITNLDEHSPSGLVHMRNVVDINLCDRLPDPEQTAHIGHAARDIASQYGLGPAGVAAAAGRALVMTMTVTTASRSGGAGTAAFPALIANLDRRPGRSGRRRPLVREDRSGDRPGDLPRGALRRRRRAARGRGRPARAAGVGGADRRQARRHPAADRPADARAARGDRRAGRRARPGKSTKDALGETDAAIEMGFFVAGEGRRFYGQTTTSAVPNKAAMIVRQPLGVAGLIIAANTPIANVAWKAFPALLCGNAAILKAAEDTPLSAWAFGVLAREAGVPDGVYATLHGLGRRGRRAAGRASRTSPSSASPARATSAAGSPRRPAGAWPRPASNSAARTR